MKRAVTREETLYEAARKEEENKEKIKKEKKTMCVMGLEGGTLRVSITRRHFFACQPMKRLPHLLYNWVTGVLFFSLFLFLSQ